MGWYNPMAGTCHGIVPAKTKIHLFNDNDKTLT